MKDNIEVRRAAWSDRERIFAFYQSVYPDWEKRIPERWDWQITHNPFRPEGPPPVWLAVDPDGRVIGQTMAMFEPLLLEGKRVYNGWSVDSFVMESYRGKGIGRKLRESMNRDMDQIMSIMMSPATRHIYLTQGYQALPALEVYLLSADPVNLTESLASLRKGWLSRGIRGLRLGYPVSWYVNQYTRRRLKSARGKTNIRFEQVECFSADIDPVWHTLQSVFTGAVIRTAEYLNWKYTAQPHVRYDIFHVHENDCLKGYLVLRRGRERGFVVDILLDPNQPGCFMRALDFAVTYFSQHGLQEVRAGSSYPPYQQLLRQAGWPKPVGVRVPLVKSCYLAEQDERITGDWLFSLGDHDMQQ